MDGGCGRCMKVDMSNTLDDWLMDEVNLGKWENGDFTASERRILLSNWVGAMWERFKAKQSSLVRKIFVKTGSGMTVDGSEDVLIHPEGTDNYTFNIPAEDEVKEVAARLAAAGGADGADAEQQGQELNEDEAQDSGVDSDDSDDPDTEPVEMKDAIPDGMVVVSEGPRTIGPELVGRLVLAKWNVVGWCVGEISRFFSKPKQLKRFNVEVTYEEGANYHRFREAGEEGEGGHYSADNDAPVGSWALLAAQ